MKKYTIKVTEKESGVTLLETEELSNTKKFLEKKYFAKFRFYEKPTNINIYRVFKKPGKQIDLLDLINEIESEVKNG